jgi:hypothetical protein
MNVEIQKIINQQQGTSVVNDSTLSTNQSVSDLSASNSDS